MAFGRLGGVVLKHKDDLFRQAEKQNELAGAVEKLREVRGGIAALPLERANHDTLTSAFGDTVQRGQAAFSLAFKDQQDENLHECRKRTKDLRYQLELTRSSHNLKEGDWLLQTAAASSVGKFVLQLAQHYRFKTINVIRRREQESIIGNLGGNEVICTADEDLRARPQELTAGKGVDRAIDCVAGELGAEVARNLAPGGTMLVYGALSSHQQTDPAKFIMPLFAPRLITGHSRRQRLCGIRLRTFKRPYVWPMVRQDRKRSC